MEIDIPDLDDVKFEERCSSWGERCDKSCTACQGTGYRPTIVGDRLIVFLERRGYVRAAGPLKEED